MGFLRKSKPNRPAIGSYQERLRAIGHQLDADQMRFRMLMEIPDGFLLKTEEPYNRQQGESGNAWAPRTFWLDEADIEVMTERAYEDRKRNRSGVNASRNVS
ncbi:MAG TPA: hypothetical protein VHV31_08955 [Nitrolancea sp.]|nr:hypothetical protein [Nitrolancea sp.]